MIFIKKQLMIKDCQSKLFLYILPVYYIYCMLIDVAFSRGSILGIVMNISIIALFIYLLFHNPYNKKFAYVYIWIFFNIILIVCNSSDPIYSLKEFGKNIIGLLCFPLSFYFISTKSEVIRFVKVLIVLMLLYIMNLILANIFGWGQAYGGVDNKYAIEGGASIVTGSMPIIMALIMAPFILSMTSQKILFISVWSVTAICTLLIFKRTNIASLFLGYLLLIMLYGIYQQKYKIHISEIEIKRRVGILSAFLVLMGILLSVFGTLIYAQYELRSRKFEDGALEKEGRIIEWYLVKKAILDSDQISTFLFGKEPYNTINNYGFETDRNIHGDFSMILFSTGSVGTILYWSMQLYISLLVFQYNKKRYLNSNQDILLFVIFLSTSAIWFLFCFSATLRYVLLSSVYYMIHGMILRYFWNKHQKQNRLILLWRKKYESFNCRKL